ncbi:MAG TPA: ABC transporter substrate-binding protein [Acetobacteraceae bacterium]|nr:ABC transporter substrate-binding protein [Acetobacteraceae bacterium]
MNKDLRNRPIYRPIRRRGLLGTAASASVLAAAGRLPGFGPGTARAASAGGGNVLVTFQSDVATLDPAIGYDWQNWSMIKSLFNGLMGYKPGTTELIPDLAESFTVSSDGKTYTFTLRQGVKFHNGRALTAEDVRYSIARTVDPKTQSPGQSFFSAIEGYDQASAGKGPLTGVRAVDPKTVVVQLADLDAAILHKLALNFAFAVPKEAVDKYGKDFGKNPVGTGAFFMKEWVLGQHILFNRNPDYFTPGQPMLDSLTFQLGQDPTVALLRFQRGEVDLLGDGIPPAQFVSVMNNSRWRKDVVEGTQLETSYITLNTRIKPLDDVRVRRAINMAIDKERIVRIINNRAVVANQPLPPAMPGYDPNYKGYPFDPAGAKKLLAEAGVGNGFSTALYCMNVDPNPRIAQAIQQDLANIGINAEVKSLAQATVIDAGGTEGEAPMVWSGGMAWIDDYPDPSDFYYPILGCGGAVKGGWNWSWYCNEKMESMAKAADALVKPSEAAQRIDMWRKIFIAIMSDAAWVPVFNEKRYTVHQPSVKAASEDIFVDPINIPVNYNMIYKSNA